MTVNVSKPAFNIREKLSELEFGHLPYEKMPPGSIIQHKTVDSTSNVNTNSSSYANLSNVTLYFSPKLDTSVLEITLTGTVRFLTGSNTRSRPDFRLVESGTVLSGYQFSEALQVRNCNFAGSAVELSVPFHFVVRTFPHTTETLEYTWQWRNVDNVLIDLGGVSYRQTIMEIRQ